MIRYLYILLLFTLLPVHIHAQERIVRGQVYNEFDDILRNVKISVLGTKIYAVSNSKGFFKINIGISDTLLFSKEFYIDSVIILSNYKKKKIILNFDTELFIKIAENDSTIFKPDSIHGSSQPLFIVDGTLPTNLNFEQLTENDIKSIKVIKGQDAIRNFGVYAMNGAIWVTTKRDIFNVKKKNIQICIESDILNAPFGFGVSTKTDSVFKRSFPISYYTFYKTDFKNNYAFNLGITKHNMYKIFNIRASLGVDFDRKYYLSNNFDFKKISIINGISINKFYMNLNFGFQELNTFKNIGIETGLCRHFSKINMTIGSSVGYWEDYMVFDAFVRKTLFKSNFNLKLFYERIDNFDICSLGLSYDIYYWKKYK